jgi:hypothetical protein
MVVVTEGVKPGENVIVEGFQRVRQSIPVTAKPYPGSFELGGTLETPQKNSRLGDF